MWNSAYRLFAYIKLVTNYPESVPIRLITRKNQTIQTLFAIFFVILRSVFIGETPLHSSE